MSNPFNADPSLREHLLELRIRQGLSWAAIAKKLGVGAGTAFNEGKAMGLYTGRRRSKESRKVGKFYTFMPTAEIQATFRENLKREIEEAALEMACCRIPYKPSIPEWGV